MIGRWVLHLRGPADAEIELAHLHAAVSTWFDARPSTTDPDADAHNDRVKDWSLSAPRREGNLRVVEVGTLTQSARVTLQAHATPGARLRLGSATFHLADEPSQVFELTSWDSLQQASTVTTWKVDFLTPTTFTRGSDSSPLPSPERLIRSLARCWDAWGPGIEILDATRSARGILVLDVEGRTVHLTVGHRHLAGFVGTITYRVPPESTALLSPLFALAPYAGIGAATVKGLGTVRVHGVR